MISCATDSMKHHIMESDLYAINTPDGMMTK